MMQENQDDERGDEQIALLVQKGDKEKFGILMERYEKRLKRYGNRFLSDSDNIDDIIQDVFVSTYENINSFDSSQKFSSWVYRIAHNAFVNGLRKNEKNPIPYFDLDVFVSHHIYVDPMKVEKEAEELKKIIEIGLDKLKTKYKEVIILHFLEELGYREISDILHIPIGTVGIRIKRGKEALRKIYVEMNIQYEQ